MGNVLRGCVPMLFSALLTGAAESPWRTYEVYQPTITRYLVNDADTQRLKYNHDSSIAWFGDRWFCLWNANVPAAESQPGQLNYQSTSPDGKTWSAPVACFAETAHSANPVPCAKGTQWQPNLIEVEDELWAVWSQNSRDEYNGAYLSRRRSPDARWVNERILFAGQPEVLLDGKKFRVFPTQNPIRLRSGRVLAPATLMGPAADDAPAGLEHWWTLEKRDTVLYTDDLGRSWSCSPGTVQPGRSWAQWEPTVWELDSGTVMMFARNNDLRSASQGGPRPTEMLLCSESRDQGATWSQHLPVALETVCSRMHVLPTAGNRFMMVHNDWPAGNFCDDRRNLALFFNRGGGSDFAAGVGISADEPAVMYPMMWVRDNTALISYSQGFNERSIKVARVSPLPDPARYYLFPRSNLPDSQRPVLAAGVLRFSGGQRLATSAVLDPGLRGFSLGAWLRRCQGGALLDSRCATTPGGVLMGLVGDRPYIYLGTADHNLVAELRLEREGWNYVGVSVDLTAATVLFVVNGQVETLAFQGPPPKPLKAGPAVIGSPGLAASRVPRFRGELRELAVYRETCLTPTQHWQRANRQAAALGRALLAPTESAAEIEPAVLLDPGAPDRLQADFVLPEDTRPGAVAALSEGGLGLLQVTGEASVGIDLDENRRAAGDSVTLQLRLRLEQGESQVLLTIGDANQPARLRQREGVLVLAADGQQRELGRVLPNTWFEVTVHSSQGQTSAQLEKGVSVSVEHRPVATWAYIGQGYRDGAGPANSRFALDVGALRSRVTRP
jgi:hypothetical protein